MMRRKKIVIKKIKTTKNIKEEIVLKTFLKKKKKRKEKLNHIIIKVSPRIKRSLQNTIKATIKRKLILFFNEQKKPNSVT